MSVSCPVRLRVSKVANIQVERPLSAPGEILVRRGQKVSPEETIGEAKVFPEPAVFNLVKLLGVKREKAKATLLRGLGETVKTHEPIASSKSLLFGKKTLLAPCSGTLKDWDEKGLLIFQPEARGLERAPAGFWGEVIKVEKGKSATLKTNYLKIKAVLGRGSAFGVLKVLRGREEVLIHSDIDESKKGMVLVAGALLPRDTLKKARVLEVAGFITGGIHARTFEEAGLPVLVTEGFGRLPLGEDIWETLKRYEGRIVFLEGEKNELKIPLKEEETVEGCSGEPLKTRKLKVGDKVRFIGGPGTIGTQGRVVGIGPKKATLASGLRAVLARVKVYEEELKVPVSNLEIIGTIRDIER